MCFQETLLLTTLRRTLYLVSRLREGCYGCCTSRLKAHAVCGAVQLQLSGNCGQRGGYSGPVCCSGIALTSRSSTEVT